MLAGVEVAAGGKNLPPKVVADSGGPVLRPVLLPTHIHLSQDMLHKKAVERSSHRILIFPAFIKLKLFFFFSIFSKPSNILKKGIFFCMKEGGNTFRVQVMTLITYTPPQPNPAPPLKSVMQAL